jgi:hypothetical protein
MGCDGWDKGGPYILPKALSIRTRIELLIPILIAYGAMVSLK